MDSGDTTLDAGTTPLMRAARAGDTAVIRLLLDKGADPKLTTKDGNTALMFAAGVGYRDKNTRGSESDALAALKLCVDAGLDLHQVNNQGETALHGAADRGADTIVQFLVDRGAESERQDQDRDSRLSMSRWASRASSSFRSPKRAPWPSCENSAPSKAKT